MNLRQVFDDLVRFETELWNAVDARLLRECGVSLATLNVLLVLDRQGSCRVQDLAAALSITVGGASQAVDRLEKRGLCARVHNPDDRRSNLLQLTEPGRAALAAAKPSFDAELQTWFASPTPAGDLHRFAAVLTDLRAAATHRAQLTSHPATAEESSPVHERAARSDP